MAQIVLRNTSGARAARDRYPGQPLVPALAGSAGQYDEAAEHESGLIEYWRIVRRRKGTVILVTLLGLTAAVLVTVPQTPVYRAQTTLEVQDLNQEFMNLKQVSPVVEASSSSLNGLSDLQTQIKILQSEALTDRTMAKLRTASPSGLKEARSWTSDWRRALNLKEPASADQRDAALLATAKSVKIRAADQTRIIEVRVDSADPKLASDFANTLASEFIEQNMEARFQMTQRTGEWLGRQLGDMKVKLERSEDALQANARQNGLIITTDRQNVSEEKLRQLQAELSRAQAERVARQSRYEITRTATAETIPEVLSDGHLRTLQTTLADLRRQDADLATTFKPDYPKTKRIRAQIGELESAMQRERTAILARIGNEYQEARRREDLLTFAYGAQTRVVSQDSERSVKYNILKREVDTNRQIYEAMLQRVKESGIASAMKASNIRIIDTAKVPKKPFKPIFAFNATLGIVCGLMLGVAVVVMKDRADHSLHEPGDASYYTGLPELGVVPSASAGGLPAEQKSGADRLALAVSRNGPSLMAEGFRALVVSLVFSGKNGSRPRVVVITSPGPGEGKTTTASNLAIALAQIDQRVLLIDGDLRKPRMHDIFGLDNSTGLVDILRLRTPDEELEDGLVRDSGVPNLSILTSGRSSNPVCNLIFSTAMPALIARFKKQYDSVIIDAPPMLQMPDARVLARMSDGVILVARAGKTTRDAALAASQRLAQDRTRVLGIILNDWNPKHVSGGYYHYNGNSQRAG